MIRKILYGLLVLLFTVSFSFADTLTEGQDKINTKKAIVLVDNLNFREQPNIKSKSLGKLTTGDIVDIIAIDNNKFKIVSMEDYWYKVRFNNIEGYLFGFFIAEFSGDHIIQSNKNGVILFLDNNYKFIKKIEYSSYFMVLEKLKIDKNTKKEANLVDIINDEFVILKTINFYYVGSEFLISQYSIYSSKGVRFLSNQGVPVVFYSKSLNYLILNKAELDSSNKTTYLGKINVFSNTGILVKEFSVNMETEYKDEFGKNEFILNNSGDTFIWVNSSKAMVLNLRKLKVSYNEFEDIKKLNPEKVFINIENAELHDNELLVELLPFNFQEGLDLDKIIISINIDQPLPR